ncbi:MAG TPA: glycosyl hydrolase family 28-related protein [Terriglobia bacterium]|nr:glycosyl hydrolase family 28-related protein [Terriglobia bacterium]
MNRLTSRAQADRRPVWTCHLALAWCALALLIPCRLARAACDVKAQGARGDDLADDAAAIQSCVDSLPAAGGTVHFPVGTYRTTATVVVRTPGVIFEGEGRHPMTSSALPATCLDYQAAAGDALLVLAPGFAMRDMGIRYPTISGAAIDSRGGYLLLRDVKLTSTLGPAVDLSVGVLSLLGSNVRIEDSHISGFALAVDLEGANAESALVYSHLQGNGIGLRTGDGTAPSMALISVRDSDFESNALANFELTEGAPVNIEDNYMEVNGPTATNLRAGKVDPMGELIGLGSGGATQTFQGTLAHPPVEPGSFLILAGGAGGWDDGSGAVSGSGVTGSVDYADGAYAVSFTPGAAAGVAVIANYRSSGFFTAVHNLNFRGNYVQCGGNTQPDIVLHNVHGVVIDGNAFINCPANPLALSDAAHASGLTFIHNTFQ